MSVSSCKVNVSQNRAALYLCIMTDSLWIRSETSRLSPDTSVILRSRISNNSCAESFIGPRVSTATGRNRYAVDSSEYFWHSLLADISVTSPWPRAAAATKDSAVVLTTVTSQTKSFLERHRIWVIPSGRLPSLRIRPTCSFIIIIIIIIIF